MYNNKIFIMIMAGSMTMGLLNSSDCLSKTINENNDNTIKFNKEIKII